VIGFVHEARNYGFKAGIQCSQDSIASVLHGLWKDKDEFEYALASIFCTDRDERDLFNQLFTRFWRDRGSRVRQKTNYHNLKKLYRKSQNIAVMLGAGVKNESVAEEESKTTSGANATEILKKTDFTKLTVDQTGMLDEIAEKLVRDMSLRIKRKRKKSNKGTIDLGRTLRNSIQHGGSFIDLHKLERKKEKYRLLVLLDISGSMDKYSFFLLKFLWALRSNFKDFEAFTFSTQLQRITDLLSEKDMHEALFNISQNVNNWSGGTKIGEALREFNDVHAKRYLNGSTMTIILSDGLDTGEPEILEEAIEKIRLRSKKLVWLNPLKGMQGYEPIQKGMKTVLPVVNHFGAAHNFYSLLELENILINA
jgi:uncharacterized protein with von Willebrand factor type A (vWA) domain